LFAPRQTDTKDLNANVANQRIDANLTVRDRVAEVNAGSARGFLFGTDPRDIRFASRASVPKKMHVRARSDLIAE